MRGVWKYPLGLDGHTQEHEMPVGARVLAVGMQHNLPTMWAEVDPAADTEARRFVVFGTGHRIPTDVEARLTYLGSAVSDAFVWHVYELGK